MPFTISPAEAQAIQEDEAQLLSAIAQVAQRIPGVLRPISNGAGQSNPDAFNHGFRIKMGRRLVYGKLADGPFRHELDANSLKVIADALQRPVTPNIELEKYARKIPAIEIFHGDVLLFREERDGTITTNSILLEIEQAKQQDTNLDPSLEQNPAPQAENIQGANVEPVQNGFATDRAQHILTTAEHLLNPLRQPQAIYDEVSVHGYQIQKQEQEITIRQDGRLVLEARKGKTISHQVTDQDWAILGAIQVPERFPTPVLNDFPKAVINESLSQNGETADSPLETPAAKALPIQDSILENPDEQGIADAIVLPETPSALSVLAHETESLPVSPTRQLLNTAIRDWRQQVSNNVSTRLQQGAQWLAMQQTAVQNQRLAYAVYRLFQRGYERTGEHSYHVRGCTIKRRGQNLYVLKDSVGELMKFKTSKVMGIGRRLSVISVSDRLTPHQRQNLLDHQLDSAAMPQGSLDVEAAYATRTQQVEQTVRQFLKSYAHAHTWDRENGQFKMEIGEGDALRITDKQDGRGVVFERNKGNVSSKLNGQDFAHFERLAAKMQSMAEKQGQPAVRTKKQTLKKSSAIEMD